MGPGGLEAWDWDKSYDPGLVDLFDLLQFLRIEGIDAKLFHSLVKASLKR